MSRLRTLTARREFLNEIETNFITASMVKSPVDEDAIGAWRERQAEAALHSCPLETNEDAQSLVYMATRHGSNFLLKK